MDPKKLKRQGTGKQLPSQTSPSNTDFLQLLLFDLPKGNNVENAAPEKFKRNFELATQDPGLLEDFAEMDSRSFDLEHGSQLLIWILRESPSLLTQKSASTRPNMIHLAIAAENHGFMDCLLDFAEKSNLAEALETCDRENKNCLHLAISKQLPCAAKMVAKCSDKALGMQNNQNDTPLHILMEKRARSWPQARVIAMDGTEPADSNMSKPIAAASHSNPKVKPKLPHSSNSANVITESADFDPVEVLKAIQNHKSSAPLAQRMAGLLTVTNKDGLSPYQIRYQTFLENKKKEKRRADVEKDNSDSDQREWTARLRQDRERRLRRELEEDNKLLSAFRDIIFDCLTDIPDIRKALYGTKGSEKELCLDMSDFNQSSHDFTRFVQQLRESPEASLDFEQTLFYVYLPDLNTFNKKCPHDGVRSLFEWLRNDKKVSRIKHLNMCDSTTSPMSDELVKKAILNQFEIEKFDWRKLDIDLSILTSSPHAEYFADITLYSSGSWSVLHHWTSEDGLARLKGLRKVRIEIMELNPLHDKAAHADHADVMKEHQKKLAQRLYGLKNEKKREGSINLDYDVEIQGKWDFRVLQYQEDDDPFIPDLKLLEQLKRSHNFLRGLLKEKSNQLQSQKAGWAKTFENLAKDRDNGIKVAIIDNGADKIRTSVRENIDRGISFVPADSDTGDRLLPWWMVADPHGTQMASLIKKTNPFVRLYIARVGKGRRDILPENAAKAVEWAIEQKVDVISMSWITKKNIERLRRAVHEANQKNILVFCSTADEGEYSGKVYPASHDGAMSVAATDIYGHLRPASKAGVSILVPGESIMADGPSYMTKYMKEAVAVSGSSVATALASGIASMALFLLKVFNDNEDKLKGFLADNGIMRVFHKMKNDVHGIDLSTLFPEEISRLPEAWDISKFPEIPKDS